jgi:polyisoprenoid-binding protein YceI
MSTDTPSTDTSQLTGDYELDPVHSRLGFAARHAMVTTVRGSFRTFTGTIRLDGADPARSGATVAIDAASLSTEHEQRDGHLRSADFLDVEAHPRITFASTEVEQIGEDGYRLIGDLTIRDVIRPITLDLTFGGSVTDPYGQLRAGFEGSATINRKDFGLTWNTVLETGGFLVSDKVTIELDISAVKTNPDAQAGAS